MEQLLDKTIQRVEGLEVRVANLERTQNSTTDAEANAVASIMWAFAFMTVSMIIGGTISAVLKK